MSAGAICRPATFPLRAIMRCPTCRRRRRFSGLDAAWYGPTWTCCACGDSFSDGERLMRPARRGWRVEAANQAKRVWNDAAGLARDDHWAWLRTEIYGDEAVAP